MEKYNLTETYLRLRSRLKTMATFILKNEEDADDALQEAFCKLLSRKESCQDGQADGLAVVAVRRTCLSYLRRRSLRETLPVDDGLSVSDVSGTTVWDDEYIKDMTRIMMSRLSPMQKSVFDMVSQGIDYDIIAIRLGISEESVRQNICRARKILRNEYKRFQ